MKECKENRESCFLCSKNSRTQFLKKSIKKKESFWFCVLYFRCRHLLDKQASPACLLLLLNLKLSQLKLTQSLQKKCYLFLDCWIFVVAIIPLRFTHISIHVEIHCCCERQTLWHQKKTSHWEKKKRQVRLQDYLFI